MAVIGNSSTTQAFTPAVDYFSGNASTTAFTLSRPVASVAQVQVVVNNVAQNPSSAYTVSSNTITFTSAPSSGTNNIYVYYTSPITQVIAPGQGTVTSTSLASSTGSGSVVLATSPTITTPTISSLSSASATALTLQSAGTTAITVDTSQNVGIGTTTPASKLNITDASANSLRISGAGDHALGFTGYSSNAATQVFSIRNDGINNCYINTQNSTPLSFGVSTGTSFGSTTEHMRINSSGNVGIGITPTVRFQVSGSSIFSDTVQVFNTPTSGGSGQQGILFRNTYNAGGSIFSMGSATTNDLILWYGGSGTQGSITGNGAGINYSSASDYRLKENVAPMTGALAKVAQLKPCTYTWKFDGSDGQGFIAHELQSVFPDAVTGEKDAVETYTDEEGNEKTKIKAQGVDTSFVVATLAAAIQELKAINDTQAATINALTARIETLENK